MRAKIVIVGGGVMGVSIALQTAQQTDSLSDPVMLLERGAIGDGSSGRSSAVLRQFYGSRCTAGMARDSLKHYSGFENKTGRSIGFLRTGVLTLCLSREPADIAYLEELVTMQASIGIDVSVANASEIRELVHGVEIEDGTFGAWECGAGCLDAERTLEAFTTLARNKGAVVREGTAVEEILVEGGRVTGVRTSSGEIACERVVIAAGPWSAKLLAKLGLNYPLAATRTEHLFVCSNDPKLAAEFDDPKYGMHGPEDSGATTWVSREMLHAVLSGEPSPEQENQAPSAAGVAHPVLIDPQIGFYTRCEPLHSRARIGRFSHKDSTVVPNPDALDEEVSDEFRTWALDALSKRMPEYKNIQVVGAEAGMYTMTPDEQAMIGPVPEIDGLYLVSGFSGHGFKLAPSVGEGVAQMLLDQPVSAFEPEFFAPARFGAGVATAPRAPFGL